MTKEDIKVKKVTNIIAFILVAILTTFTIIYIASDLFLTINFEKMYPGWNVGYAVLPSEEIPQTWYKLEETIEIISPIFKITLLASTIIFITELFNKKADKVGLAFGIPLLITALGTTIKAILNYQNNTLDNTLIIIIIIIIFLIVWKILSKKLHKIK